MAAPFDLAGHQIEVTASVDIAFSGPGRDIAEALLRDADFAMYQAKSDGGGHHQVMTPAARIAGGRREELERDLAQAQHRDQLALDSSPSLMSTAAHWSPSKPCLRWHHPTRGTVMAGTLIPSAARTGLILALGKWVLRRACHDLQAWQAHGPAIPAIAENVSAHQVMGPAFAQTVQRVLRDTGADPGAVCLAVTESVFLTDAPPALAVMRQPKDLGVALSLDDFGTGYSSLSYLRQFPFDIVKIDRGFTANVPTDTATRSIVGAMIDFRHVSLSGPSGSALGSNADVGHPRAP
jgi:EAL domain-containing protein (putative c-di-GMP-specific phosphodiesterase class I)